MILSSKSKLSNALIELGVLSWSEALDYIARLPYGRNKNRFDFNLVLSEQKGSCSSKHGFLKTIAEENNIADVKLMLGIYKMNRSNHSFSDRNS